MQDFKVVPFFGFSSHSLHAVPIFLISGKLPSQMRKLNFIILIITGDE